MARNDLGHCWCATLALPCAVMNACDPGCSQGASSSARDRMCLGFKLTRCNHHRQFVDLGKHAPEACGRETVDFDHDLEELATQSMRMHRLGHKVLRLHAL